MSAWHGYRVGAEAVRLFTIRDGTVTRLVNGADSDRALAALGLDA